MIGLKIRFQPTRDFSNLGEKQQAKGNSVLLKLGKQLNEKISNQFATGVDSYGMPWQPLSSRTIKNKKRIAAGKKQRFRVRALFGRPEQILVESGVMWQKRQKYAVASGQITLSNTRKFAKIHQEGGGRVPARPIFPNANNLPNDWIDVINLALYEYAKRVYNLPN